LPTLKMADLRPILPRLLLKTRAGAGRMQRCLFGEGKSANFNPDEYISHIPQVKKHSHIFSEMVAPKPAEYGA